MKMCVADHTGGSAAPGGAEVRYCARAASICMRARARRLALAVDAEANRADGSRCCTASRCAQTLKPPMMQY